MKILVTGSAGHLGEALVRTLREAQHDVAGVDILASPYTDQVASITDRETMRRMLHGVEAVCHAASLHKPHLVTHSSRDFVNVNVEGTLVLLEEAAAAGVASFVYTSTTSVFGQALRPRPGEPAAWITEDVVPIPKNMYGVTKRAAEDLCEMFHRRGAMDCVVLRTSRFFPEEDDRAEIRGAYDDLNVKVNEYLYRRGELEDMVSAHLCALQRAADIGFGRYIVSATTPFGRDDAAALARNAPAVAARYVPEFQEEYRRRGWRMFPAIDRVYMNERARRELGWTPKCDFAYVVKCLAAGEEPRSALSRQVGSKGYHDRAFSDGPFPVESL